MKRRVERILRHERRERIEPPLLSVVPGTRTELEPGLPGSRFRGNAKEVNGNDARGVNGSGDGAVNAEESGERFFTGAGPDAPAGAIDGRRH